MGDFSVLIGGKAGFGIDKSGLIIGRLLNRLSWRIYIYRDYPSLIRGGHAFSIIRASCNRIAAHPTKVDCILALNQDTLDFHRERIKENTLVIYDADSVKPQGISSAVKALGVPLGKILKEENAAELMRNTALIGAFVRAIGIPRAILEQVLKKEISRELELNLKVAFRGYDAASESVKIEPLAQSPLPLVTGNEAIGLGLIKAGLDAYVAYPMTPSSPILHFLAGVAAEFGLEVIHPESEIAVILMALGFSYMGKRAAVGTSGGGFCLMTEALSFAGMSELPLVIILGQRPGPSTGLPTYSAQTELHFALNAGQGEFSRFVVAPGDAEEAYFWSAYALNAAWKYQLPAIVLSDKNLGEGVYNFDHDIPGPIKEEGPFLWDKKSPYKRYVDTENGISPLAFVPEKGAVTKANSYEHDEYGITTEEPGLTKLMQAKRLRKEKYLAQELQALEAVKVYGNKESSTAVLCWGSNKAVAQEAAGRLGLRVVQPLVMCPFPLGQFKSALSGVKKIICVENNASGQLAQLIRNYGFNAQEQILKYDGRPFTLDELESLLEGKLP